MKKVFVLFSILFVIFFISGCHNDFVIEFKEDPEHEIMNNTTYRFVGESEHFYFQTGKVNYDGNERFLLISHFGIKEKIENANYNINLYFNDQLFYEEGTLSDKEYTNTVISEHGILGESDKNGDIIGESNAFLETTKDSFKESIKIEITYCFYNVCTQENCVKEDCNTETLNLLYVD